MTRQADVPIERTAWQPGLWLRFGAVGLLNTAFSYTVFALLELMGCWSAVALAASTIAGVLFNFHTSRRLVFHANGPIVCFLAVYTFIFCLNWAALRTLHWYGLADLNRRRC